MASLQYYNSRVKTYVETVYVVAAKNLKLRYRDSVLGFMWTLINPLFMLSVFVFVLGKVIRGTDNYPLYVLSGLIFWNFFTTSSAQMINKIYESRGILKSVNIPPIIFPLSALFSNLINFLLTFIPFFALMIWFGYRPGAITLLLIPLTLVFALFTYSIAMTLCCLNVYFRDVEMFWTTITPALLYATPVVYETPRMMEKYMNLNPFAHFMELSRAILYKSQYAKYDEVLPDIIIREFTITTIITLILFGISLYVYKVLRKGFISNF